MHVGILSMQRVLNYGSLLQAYALKKSIERLGHECSFLDIEKGIQLKCHTEGKNPEKRSVKTLVQKLETEGIKIVNNYLHHKRYRSRFRTDFLPLLGITEETITEKQFDIVVIGSDEVFNFVQHSDWGFSKQLFGHGISAKKVITYAASFGWTTLNDVLQYGVASDLKQAIKNLSNISIRDENSYKIIKFLTNREPAIHLDPTFIYNFEPELPKTSHYSDYIALYSYRGRTDSKIEKKAIRKFAAANKKNIYSLGFYHAWCDKNLLVDPFEFLNLFKNAAYVVTDTFHGTVFSIIFQKRFCTIVRKSNSEKISYLLKQFELQDRIASSVAQIDDILQTPINYSPVNRILDKKREESITYLQNELFFNEPIDIRQTSY